MAEEKSYISFDDAGLINIEDNLVGLEMLDKFSRMQDERRIKPLEHEDNVIYPHRYLYDGYNLLIGDTYFMIPPEFISVTSEASPQTIITLRQENTQKMKSGYHKRTVMIDLVFNGIEQLNGYPVNGPEGIYYVDGLRQLLAQFKCTPFLPITNELINGMYGIFTVALQSIVIHTLDGYPNAMGAFITLQEVNMFPYLQMPDAAFKYMIDWDLFRFYYQRMLTENHTYKKLQSLPENSENRNRFKLSILDESVFSSEKATEYNLLEIICDKKIVKTTVDGFSDTTNYTTWVDSDTDNIVITSFQSGYANLLTNVQLSDAGSPTVQFMGGMDTNYKITFETTDYSVVQSLEQCQITNDVLVRGNRKFNSLGFIKLESELVEFTGSLFVLIEGVKTNTVPGFPGLYSVEVLCVSYDIAQSEREELKGFMPFECEKEGKCGKYVKGEGYVSEHTHEDQAIEQSMDGLFVKIKQDAYAEWKLRTSIEVYPDLHLPTYDEVDEVITKIRNFREKNKLTQLGYTKYPKAPTCMLHGLDINNETKFDFANDSKSIIDINTIDDSVNQYNVFVDPDFYVFYPSSYKSFLEDDEECFNAYKPKQRTTKKKTKTIVKTPNYGSQSNESLIEQFISLAETFVGHTYKRGAAGDQSDEKGLMFDCAGFVCYLLKKIGVMPTDTPYQGVSRIPGNELYEEIRWDEKQRGDILCQTDLEHVIIYKGDNQIIHASNSNPYPRGGVKEGNLYLTGDDGRCFRPKAFMQASVIQETVVNNTSEYIWKLLKGYGLSDYAAAAVLGNAHAESGVSSKNLQGSYESSLNHTDDSYTAGVDDGSYTRDKFINDSAGYGLFQFTYYTLKEELYDEAKKRGVSISDTRLQVDVMISQITENGVITEINNAKSVEEASNIFMTKYENPADQSSTKKKQRAGYSQDFYNKFNGTTTDTTNVLTVDYCLTENEFSSICKIIMAETQGESKDAEKAMAQVIYDRLTHPNKKFGGLSNIISDRTQFPSPYEGELNDTIEKTVKAVFCENDKYWPEAQAWYFLTSDDSTVSFKDRDNNYNRLGEVDTHTYWGKETKGSTIKYTIIKTNGTSATSSNNVLLTEELVYEPTLLESAKKFGQPVYVKTEAIMYDNNWFPWTNKEGQIAQKELNSVENIFNTTFCDEVQYSGRGKLVRAFPAYLFCILDDQAQWYDGSKLWTNYYTHKSVVDIAVHATNDMPTETATITVTNSYHNLDRVQGGLSSYSIKEDDEYGAFSQWWYSWSGAVWGFGPKLTDKLIQLHQVIYDHALLREGARVHLRMGYGSDPLSLAPVMNGHVSDISLGDQITIVVTSDGSELIQHITSTKEKDTNQGWLGLFGLGEDQESSNIIASTLCERKSWVTHLARNTFEASKYGIEHFGLYFNKGWMTLGDLISDMWDGNQEQYDMLKNIYKANYKRQHYIYTTCEMFGGDEQNIIFNKYNMTPWDVFQICTQQVPEYIIKPSYHQFDSRLYFGSPLWLEKYRYDYLDGKVYEECKTAAQAHFIDSMDCIIDNQIRVTSKFHNTNIKVMYTRGEELTSTDIIHSDDSIDFSKQKTTILDTPITQDALGPDALYEILGYSIGEDSARRVGISNLLYGWQQQYQGQILLLGHPGLKPHDYVMINDTFANLYGLATVREVVHSFNAYTGFTTSIVPGLIGFSTDENSGLIHSTQNYLMLLNCFSSYTLVRKNLRNNYEKNLSVISDLEMLKEKLKINTTKEILLDVADPITDILLGANDVRVVVSKSKEIFNFTKKLYDMKKTGKLVETFMNGYKVGDKIYDGYKVVKATGKGIKVTLAAIKAGSIATGTAAGGVPGLVVAALWLAADILLDELFEWLSNQNVCTLLPLWWEGYPFVSGVKDGEKILLMNNNANATEENTREDGHASDVEG